MTIRSSCLTDPPRNAFRLQALLRCLGLLAASTSLYGGAASLC